eukprot:gnl/Ergobibamus_cyprinoides/141.p1 GENE.gnl/Ergobibamus_cyprinoides/141~~gnl/Ergobibamus_cyprinoides/141.p1  ORF type:complete len:432 (+),score=183.77 gnl/Ergobibamus_cyprinoides/141:82-1377(+)
MVTGDFPATAAAISRQIGILSLPTVDEIAKERGISPADVDPSEVHARVVHGDELRGMDAADMDALVRDYDELVFARTSPQQKLQIVEAFQRNGHICAVTGDGVNDSPALKCADIGIAMKSGSEVSMEAANMILIDDAFDSIVNGVLEGRLIFTNLAKSICYTLSSNIPEIMPFLCYIIFGIPLALSTVLILCVDLGTDLVPAISLAYEPPEDDIMAPSPRNAKKDRLVTPKLIAFAYLQIGVLQALAGFTSFWVTLMDDSYDDATAAFPANCDKQCKYDLVNALTENDTRYALADSFWQFGIFNRASVGFNPTDMYYDRYLAAQTASFFTIIIVQVADILIVKSIRDTLLRKGTMRSNGHLIFGIFFENLLGLALAFIPLCNTVLSTRPFSFMNIVWAFPWAILIFVYDEIRKLLIRRSPHGAVARLTKWH